MEKLQQGFVHIYTGNGKGKSTAAIGQAVRAAGFNLKTYIAQFMKEFPYNELNSLKHLSEWITIEQEKYLRNTSPMDCVKLSLAGMKAILSPA